MSKVLVLISSFIMVFFFVSCGKVSQLEEGISYEAEGKSDVTGVSMNAEKRTYKDNVAEINVVWTNDTDKEYLFGEPFSIQKLDGVEWKQFGNSTAVFTSIGYPLKPHTQKKHTYNIRTFADRLEKGEYQIVAEFLSVRSPGDYDSYKVTTIFKVE